MSLRRRRGRSPRPAARSRRPPSRRRPAHRRPTAAVSPRRRRRYRRWSTRAMIVRLVSRSANTRASSSSAAVPDSSAAELRPAPSRCATIRIGAAPVEPARLRDHVCERALAVDRLPRRSGRCAPRSRHRRSRRAPRASAPRSAPALRRRDCPGAAVGSSRQGAGVRRYAGAPSNASGASVEVSGSGRDPSEKAAIAQREQERHECRAVQAPVEHRHRP